MGSRSRGIVLALVVALLGAPLFGCNTSPVRVRLAGFGKGNVDGLWFWKLQNGSYRRICRVDLSDAFLSGGREVVNYKQTCLDGRTSSVAWQAVVQRSAANPQDVTLQLVYLRAGTPATHRATSFNKLGESALSSTAQQL